MGKRGLSADEKRDKMLDWFFDHKDESLVVPLKELESKCAKDTGIVSKTIKEIVDGLVSDGLVDTDKIGTSVYFWAFPSKHSQKLQSQVEDLKVQLKSAEEQGNELAKLLEEAKKGRENTDERNGILMDLKQKQLELEAIERDLESLRENDPAIVEQMENDIKIATDAVNRWTDNIFALKKWIANKTGCDEATLDKNFGVPKDLDYV